MLHYFKFLFHFLAEKAVQVTKYIYKTCIKVYSLLPPFLLGPPRLPQNSTIFWDAWLTGIIRGAPLWSVLPSMTPLLLNSWLFLIICHIKICAVSLLYTYIILNMERHNYPPELGAPIMREVRRFFGSSIPFILLTIIEDPKSFLFIWVIAIRNYHIKKLSLQWI